MDLNDCLEAEREIFLAEDEVVLGVGRTDRHLDFGSSGRTGSHHIEPLSGERLGVMTRSKNGAADQNAQIPNPGLSLLLLPRSVDPENAAVEFNDGRVWLQLPYAENDS